MGSRTEVTHLEEPGQHARAGWPLSFLLLVNLDSAAQPEGRPSPKRSWRGHRQKVAPRAPRRCSATGPSTSAGRYCSAVMIAMTPSRKIRKVASLVGAVPAGALSFFFAASEPAIARIGMA